MFQNGRIEEFLHAKTLTPEEMSSPTYSPRIARKLRQLHELDLDLDVGECGAGRPREPSLFLVIHKYLGIARALQFEDAAKAQVYKQVGFGGLGL